jgi:hypothetical protein
MNSPSFRSVSVSWPRLMAGCAVMTGLLILAVEWEPFARIADPVLGSAPLSLLVIGLLIAAVVGFGRPWAEFELRDDGVVMRKGLFFSLLRTASWIPWSVIATSDVREELDGSRSLSLRTRHGRVWKIWEKYGSGSDFDAFHREIASRLDRPRRASDAAAEAVAMRSAWDGVAARVLVGALAAGWVALAGMTGIGPAQGRGARLARLFAMALLLAPMVGRAFLHRRGAASTPTHR